MTNHRRLLGFDIPGIQRYVFAPVRPLDVMGGSRLLEGFAARAVELASKAGAEVVYCGGGSGLFAGSGLTDESVRELENRWAEELANRTAGAVELVAAAVPMAGSLPEARFRLVSALEEERTERLLARPAQTKVPAMPPSDVCQACGSEPAEVSDRVGDDVERIGRQCQARRAEGRRTRSVVLRELFASNQDDTPAEAPTDPDRPPSGAVLAAVYLDADSLGRKFAHLRTAEELRAASDAVRQTVGRAVEAVTSAAESKGLKILAPVVGGDDVLLFLDARFVPSALTALLDALTAAGRETDGVRFSGSIVFADPYAPLRHLFEVARSSLKAAKVAAHRTGEPHLAFRSLLGARLHPGAVHLFGHPLPMRYVQSNGGADSRLMRLTGAIQAIADRSQRAGLSRDLLLSESEEERGLAVEDRVARIGDRAMDRAWREAVDWSQELGGIPPSEIALGALALAELWDATEGTSR